MEPRLKRPAKLRAPWPPTDSKQSLTVTLADDWWKLAKTFKRPQEDPWDIIYYNFETYDSEEVNWYLHERLGCRAKSPTQRNYQFGRDAGDSRPIIIYIPKDDYRPPGPHQKEARDVVLAVLRDPIASHLAFKIGSVELRPGDLTAVAHAIETGKITIIHRPLAGNMAYYTPKNPYNRMEVGFDHLPGPTDRALIVHESTHASFDVRSVPLTMEQSELMGYVAQALYQGKFGADLGDSVPQPAFSVNPSNFIAWTGIFGRAAAIAKAIQTGDPSAVDLALFAAGLHLSGTYRNEPAPANDGI
jgi:hypothetical protein